MLRVFDLQEYDGLRFLSMEYVEGDDLAAVMRKGRLPIDKALSIFRQVCAGLAAAHEQGVVHRDLKPHNVLVDREGRVKVADFGLARSIADSGLTVSGAVMGSPAYMSPEQVKGDPTDERSDIYSLGVMLYQLVSGETPFRGGTPHAVMEMRLHKAPRPLFEVEPATPPTVDAVAAKCLAVNPAARFASIKELLTSLDAPERAAKPKRRWLVPVLVAGGILLGGATVVVALRGTNNEPSVPRATPAALAAGSAVVSPDDAPLIDVMITSLENRAADPLFESSLDAVIESALRRSRRIEPTAGTRLAGLRATLAPGSPIDRELGKKLAARDHTRVIMVGGSVDNKGVGVLVTLTATDTANDHVVFTQSLDIPSRDRVIPALGAWSYGLRRALGEALPASAPDLEQTGLSTNLAAVHEFAVGRSMLRSGDESGAVIRLQRAVALDPSFALGYSALAIALSNLRRGVESEQANRQAIRWIDHMCERDRLSFLGNYHGLVTDDFATSIASYEELLRKWPKDPNAEVNVVGSYQSLHQPGPAIAAAQRAVHDHPELQIAWAVLVDSELQAGNFADARRDGEMLLHNFPDPEFRGVEDLALIAFLEGRREDVRAIVAQLATRDRSQTALIEADLAMSESRLRDAAALLEASIAADRKAGEHDQIENKQLLLAEARLRLGDKRAALAAAANVKEEWRAYETAMIQLDAGAERDALDSAARLDRESSPIFRAGAKLLFAERARLHGKPAEAIAGIRESLAIDDTWLAHFYLAKALLLAGQLGDAEAELAICFARRGDGANTGNEFSSLRLVVEMTYWRARVQEAQGKPEARATYAEFLKYQSTADHDPLVLDAAKRLAALR